MLSALLLAAALRHRAAVPPPEPPPQVWFAQNASALRTTEASPDESDLAAILPLIGNARVVAFGDATHGTHEFYTLKLRLVPYLVAHAGFRTVALEGPYDLEKLDHFVKTGEGDPAAALVIQAYFFWHIQEALDLVLWIRAWNAAGNPTVTIASLDGVIPNAATAAVVDALRPIDSAAADRAAARYNCLNDYWIRDSYFQLPDYYHDDCRKGVLAERAELEARGGIDEHVLHAARRAEQSEEDFATQRLSRDAHLAENILWNTARAKTIVIGHMVHFGRLDYDFNGPRITPSGSLLTAALGSDYVSFGSLTYSGRLSQILPEGVTVVDFPPPPPTDVARTFAQGGMPAMIVAMRRVPSWLAGTRQWRIAATNAVAGKPTITIAGDLAAAYDAIIYVESTSATNLLP